MKKMTFSALFLSMSLMLTACSGGGGKAGEANQGSQAEANGGTELIVAADQDPVGLDPQKVPAASSARIYGLVYDTLTKMDENMKIIPDLADSWQVAEDGKSITFKLHQGVKFHNGREMTAEDVKYSFERILNPDTGSVAKSYFTSIDSIETPDPSTVVFKLKYPDASILANTTSSFAAIVPKEVADLNTEAVGTGPYKLDKMESGQYVILKKNPDYFQKDLPKVDTIKFQIMKDEAERMAAIRAGKVDVAQVSADTAKILEKSKNVTIKSYQSSEYSYLGINVAKKPFDDVRVRQAISYAVDRNQIVQTVWKGEAVMSGPVSPAQTAWAVDPATFPSHKLDVAKAKQLLAEAGYPNGFDTVIETASTYPDMIESAQVLQQQLKAIGINAEIKQLEWANYIETWKSKDMTMLVGRNTSGIDPDRSLRYFFATDGTANVWNYSSKQLDDLVQKALQTTDEAARKQLYEQAQQLVVDEAPNLFLASPKNFYAVSERVEGFTPSIAGEPYALVNTSLKK
ncbi:ABC transporter substrate-binding protein [Brevibacillus fulvus]|uniref:Peptide/nickel transport system substrate-binding protein n=1 Tax=Brevibacillus fulvus TaxID=1125967 RepID=A0A938Y1X1_9BACL|nr:ABC transporter substrate-binding protein [Brevibacillus fulvus]MBM7591658.1 peptide/nickel transport system substrate-binding protein [Brevibacillus fulvus]